MEMPRLFAKKTGFLPTENRSYLQCSIGYLFSLKLFTLCFLESLKPTKQKQVHLKVKKPSNVDAIKETQRALLTKSQFFTKKNRSTLKCSTGYSFCSTTLTL